MPLDVERLSLELVRGTHLVIGRALGPVLARLEAIEARPAPAAPASPAELAQALEAQLTRLAAAAMEPLLARLTAAEEAVAGHPAAIEAAVTAALAAQAKSMPDLVAEAVAALPPAPVAAPGAAGAKGDRGADGAGLADALIDRDGALVITLTDGRTKALGPVIGRDGAPGRDGADGLGFEDMSVKRVGDRGFALHFERGDKTLDFPLSVPFMLYRGVYEEGRAYAEGDNVTFGGSSWVAVKEEATERPGAGDHWQLAVKRGRDGRDGEVKPARAAAPLKVG